jgi:hypothetical protein
MSIRRTGVEWEDPDKTYCWQCQYYEYRTIAGVCLHPDNRHFTVHSNSKTNYKEWHFTNEPHVLNEDNKCKWYRRITFWRKMMVHLFGLHA